ncbi:hypothetical protein HPB51_014511 [Rhipicephalus microplus]|uniref:Uncharacterized protein n=1 Tax=Rhipicephalus microplus TaxID=6941 RepID=A0A9J6EHK4_RHIMP|nr:hypothetical protein HPB51_014511 [Rhipicephalus microplus]
MELNTSVKTAHPKPLQATKRKQISLKDKLDIERVEKKKKQDNVVVPYSLSKKTVNTIVNAKKTILSKKVSDPLPLEGQPDPSVWSAVEEAFGSQQFSNYVTADDDLVSSEQLIDEEIVARICSVPNAEQQDEDENEGGTSETVTEKVSTSQDLDYIQGLRNYFEQQATGVDDVKTLLAMETYIVSKAVCHTVQAKLTSFFQKI